MRSRRARGGRGGARRRRRPGGGPWSARGHGSAWWPPLEGVRTGRQPLSSLGDGGGGGGRGDGPGGPDRSRSPIPHWSTSIFAARWAGPPFRDAVAIDAWSEIARSSGRRQRRTGRGRRGRGATRARGSSCSARWPSGRAPWGRRARRTASAGARGSERGPQPRRPARRPRGAFGLSVFRQEPALGIEPRTARLRIGCSTTELRWRSDRHAIAHMPWRGLEPRRLAAPPPQDGVSTNFTTRAYNYGADGARTRDLSSDSRVL